MSEIKVGKTELKEEPKEKNVVDFSASACYLIDAWQTVKELEQIVEKAIVEKANDRLAQLKQLEKKDAEEKETWAEKCVRGTGEALVKKWFSTIDQKIDQSVVDGDVTISVNIYEDDLRRTISKHYSELGFDCVSYTSGSVIVKLIPKEEELMKICKSERDKIESKK